MLGFIRELKEKIEESNGIYKFKMDNERYGEKHGIKTRAVETDKRTWYHLTPYDLGKDVALEPRETNSIEAFLIYSGLEWESRLFKSISFSDTISNCLCRMPYAKLLDHREFYIYRTKEEVSGYVDVLEETEETVFLNWEIRRFRKTECRRVGKLILKEHGIAISERARITEGRTDLNLNPWKEIVEKSVEVIKDKGVIHIPI